MKAKNILMIAMAVVFVILAILYILIDRSGTDVIIDYDEENTVTIDGEGSIIVKEKKYDYNGADVMILSVENQTENAYTILIKSCFTKEDGTRENKVQWFNGFPAGYQNYFVLQPGYRFSDFECEIKTQVYSGDTLSNRISWGNDLTVEAQPVISDMYGNLLDEYITTLNFSIDYSYTLPKNSKLSYSHDIVIFDNTGEIYLIKPIWRTINKTEYSGAFKMSILLESTPWKDYKLPPELKGDIKAIVALKSIETVN